MRKQSVLASCVCSSLRISSRENVSDSGLVTGSDGRGEEDRDELLAGEPTGRRAKLARKMQNRTRSSIEYFTIELDGSIFPNPYGSTRTKTSTNEMAKIANPSGKSIE